MIGKRAAAGGLALALVLPGEALRAQPDAMQAGMLVVYGSGAPSREGDTDWREQVFFGVPAEHEGRLHVRLFDPETFGDGDFTYGGSADSETTFRLFGGAGAFSEADRPAPVPDGERGPRTGTPAPVKRPGRLIGERAWTNDPASDGRWVNLVAVSTRQGEVIDGRAWFRVDVQGTRGNDGNGYSLDVSQARDRSRPPEGLEMFSYRPTVRWNSGDPPTQLRFARTAGGKLTIQSFDAAGGRLALVTEFSDLDVRVSGQDFWASDVVETGETNLALNLLGGYEQPNDVTLAVFDAAGEPVPLAMPPRPAPLPGRPDAVASGRPLADCRSVAFDGSATTGRVPLEFLWEFGDGNTSDEPVIAHRYDEPGLYTARLSVLEPGNRPGRGDRAEVEVHVRNAPVAIPGKDAVVAPGQPLAFDGTGSQASDSPISRFRWDFGDGTAEDGARATHAYARPGQYRAVLRVEDDSAHPCDFGVAVRRVSVNFPPVAEAGTDRTSVVGQPVVFDGAASYDIDGTIAAWRWDMGDGTELEGETVTHAYAASGDYTVTLRVIDDSQVANSAAENRLRVAVNAPPAPRFTIPPRPVSVSELAVLDASASSDADGRILSWLWDFGDGVSGAGQVVNYAWTRPGTYTVTLSVTDDSGTASAVQSTTMQVRVDAAPVADAGADQFVTASEIAFDGGGSSDSDGTITAWEWDFGDGATGSGKTVRHAYRRTGSYEVALVVRDDSGAPLNADRDTMRVTINALPIADAGPPQVVAPGEEFILSGGASVDPDGHVAEYVWTFPGGATATGERVAHRLTEPGLHRIRLRVRDDFPGGAAGDEAEVLITVNAAPVAVAGADRLIAPGDSVIFDAGQSFDPDGDLTAFRWEFDDLGAPLDAARIERAYVTPGVWSAQLVVTDDSGVLNATATDDVTIRVNHPPLSEAGAPIDTERLHVVFDGSGSSDADGDALIYTWDFGDGSGPGHGVRVRHVYPRTGKFPVRLTVDDGTGLANARAVDATTATVRARPVADAGGNRDVCSGEPILFDASGSVDPDGGLLQYAWDFGDGSSSDLVNPNKTYERPGVYPVTLTIRNETGTEYGTDRDRIAALVREGPIADAGDDRTVCSNQKVRFDGSGSTDADGAVNAFAWTYGDGGTGNGETPSHTFIRPGTYAVTLTITGDAQGACSPLDSDIVNITVIAAPDLSIEGPRRAAAGVAAAYAARLGELAGARPGTFSWDFGDGTTAQGGEVLHVYDEPGEYLIGLSVDLTGGTEGCSTLGVVRKVVVNAPPEPVIDGPAQVAAGAAVAFDATMSADSDGAITGYAWDFGDGGSARTILAPHRFDEPGVYDVRLTVRDDAGVANSEVSATRKVEVLAAPAADIVAPPGLCPTEPVPWSVHAGAGTDVRWRFGDGASAKGASVGHAFDRPGVFAVRVELDNGRGLINSRASREIYARVNNSPTALAGPDRVACPGDVLVFDAGASADPDGDIASYEWTFSDGMVSHGRRVERAFDSPGEVQARLVVRDDSGAAGCDTGTDTARILVNAAPRVDAGPDRTVPVGAAHDAVGFDAGDADDRGLRFTWDFGDGSQATGAHARHAYAAPGSYTVTLRGQDDTGLACGIASDTAEITAVARE
ncbi:MAG: PKD domain-containing protein [Rhodobacteraceae bacterium]|nr:PKD domain-containing protein [Paracoccaceae bacterium]